MNITAKSFKRELSTFLRSTTTQRNKVQAFIVFGLSHLKETGDSGYLSLLMNGCVGVKSLRTQTIKEYIKGHAVGLKWSKRKDKTMGFTGTVTEFKEPVMNWFDWDTTGSAKADMDPMAQVKSLISRIGKALEEGTIKDADKGKEIQGALAAIVA